MARTNCFWGTSVTENLDSDYWTQLSAAEAGQARKFMSVRKNYGPDNVPIISAALQRVWTEGRRFQYQNGKPGAKSPDTPTGGTFWASVAAGNYDSIYIAFFEAVANAGLWTHSNPLTYSFHHEQYVTSEFGGADAGSKTDYINFHRHVYNLLVNGSGGKGPWHVSQGGNIRVGFVPHWRQFYEDQTYGLVGSTGNVTGYTFTDLNPGSSYYELLGADIYCYQNDSFTADQQWGPVRAAALAMGKPFMTGETGVAAEKGDAFVVNYLKRLDTLLKGWGAGNGAGQVIALNWTDRIVNTPGQTTTSDLRMTASNLIQAQYKSMAQDAFYGAGLDGDFTIDAGGSGGGSAPTITSFSPSSAVVGASVVVTGTNFTGATAVKVNGVNATSFVVNSATQITLVVPSTTSGKISVTQGTTATSTATLTIVSAPTITSFTPSSGIAGDQIVITGTNLTGATAVLVGSVNASAFHVDSSTQITFTIPVGAVTNKVKVTAAGTTVVSASNLTITVPAAPTITSFTPTTGAVGATVTITGTNLTGANSVQVNGTSSAFTVVSSTTITFAIPNGATTGKVFVGVPGTAGVTSAGTLTVSGTGGGSDAFVQRLDEQAPTGTGTTLTLTIPTGGVPVGHSIVIVAGSNHQAITGIADSRSNTYQSDVAATPSTALSGAIYSANVTTALLAGDTITITYAASVGGRSAVAAEYQYFITSYADAPVAASASDVTFTLTSATLTGAHATAQNAELVIAGVVLGGSGTGPGTIGVSSGWNLRGSVQQASGTIRGVGLAGRQLSATETPSVSWTWGVNDGYLALMAAYKIQLPGGGGGGGGGTAPQIRQSTPIFPTTPQTLASLKIPDWSQPVLAGSRIVVEVGVTNNQHDGIGVAVSGGQYTLTSQSPVVRRTNPAGTGAHDQESIRQFQRLNVPAGASAPTLTFSSLPGAGVYVWAVAHEVTGSHLTLAEDPIAAASASGSSATPSISSPAPSSRDAILYLASFSCGNIGTPTADASTTFAMVTSGDSAGATATAKVAGAVLSQPQTASGTVPTATVDIPGALSHNYAALLLAIPAPDTTTSGGLMGLDDTNDGTIHRHTPLQYWGQGIVATSGGNTALQNAQLLASQSDIVIANIKETDSAAGTISKDNFHGLAGAMRLVKANIALGPYCKSAEIDEGATYFPNTYYAHVVPWPTGAKLTTFSANIFVAQPTSPDQPVFASPRGFNATSMADYRAKDANHTLATYNTLQGAGTLNAIFRDSCGPTTYKNQADPLNPTSTYPTRDSWLKGQVYKIIDADLARTPNTLVVANGLVSGPAYFGGLNALLAHAHIGIAEDFLRKNYTPFADSSWPSEIQWQESVDMIVDANANQGRGVALITNIANNTAGSPGSNYVPWTTPQIAQGRRFTLGTYMLGNQGAAWICYVPDAPNTQPWAEDDPWYHAALGTPIDNPATDATGQGAALSLKTSEGVYQRRYQNGAVYVNPTNQTVTFHLDRTYYNVASDGTRGTLYGNVGDQKTLGKYDALIVYGTAPSGTNSSAPTVTIKTPVNASTVHQAAITTTASIIDADGDGIASAQARVGAGAWVNAVLAGGVWSTTLTLAVGANTVSWRATDDNASPLTSTPVSVSVTYTVVTPTAPVNVTPPSIPQSISIGDIITFDPGTWTSATPPTYLYTLQSRPKAGGTFTPVSIGSDATYTVQPSDQDTVLQLVVVANNGADSLPATSNISDPVQAASTVLFTATLQDALGRVQLSIDAPSQARLFTITRTHPSGRIVTVRGCDQAALSGGSAVVWDYEQPIGIPVVYQATVYADADTQLDQSDTITITWDTEQSWLKDPFQPARNMPIKLRRSPDYSYDYRAGVHQVMGRAAPVVVGTTRGAATGTFTFQTTTDGELDSFDAVSSSGRALLLQAADKRIRNFYFAPISLVESRIIPTYTSRRLWDFTYQRVDPPIGDGASFISWADVVAQFPDWQSVIDAYPDWGALLEGLSSTDSVTIPWDGS